MSSSVISHLANIPKGFGKNILTVGDGGDFSTLHAALAAITDNSATNPYTVLVLPGEHTLTSLLFLKSYVSIIGACRTSTVINNGSSSRIRLNGASYLTLGNFTLRYSGSAGGKGIAGAIESTAAPSTEVRFEDIDFDLHTLAGIIDERYAISFNFNTNFDMWGCRVKTECGGFYFPSLCQGRIHDTDIYLVAGQTTVPHKCISVTGATRLDIIGGRIGTGYYYDQNIADTAHDVMCVYIPASNTQTNCRIHMHGVTMFARNENAALGVNVNCIRAENGWVRAYGCHAQAELGANINANVSTGIYAAYRTSSEPVSGGKGRVDMYGCRFSGSNQLVGGNQFGVRTLTASELLDNMTGGVIRCDATAAAFTITLRGNPTATVGVAKGEVYHFIKTDASGNAVTINLNGSTYKGSALNVTLATQYASLKILWDGTEWIDA